MPPSAAAPIRERGDARLPMEGRLTGPTERRYDRAVACVYSLMPMHTADAPRDRFLSPRQASDLLGVHRASVYRAIRVGELPAVRVGRGVNRPLRVRLSDLVAWLEPVGKGN